MPSTLFHRLPFLTRDDAETLERRNSDGPNFWMSGCNCEDCDRSRLQWLRNYNPTMAYDAERYARQRIPESPQDAAYRLPYDNGNIIRADYTDDTPPRMSSPDLAENFDTVFNPNETIQPNDSMPTESFAARILSAAARLSSTTDPQPAPAVETVPVAERTPEKTIARIHAFRKQCETVLDDNQKRRDRDYRILVEIIWDTGNPERIKFQCVRTVRQGIVEENNRDTFAFLNPITGDIYSPAGYSRRCSSTPSANVYDTIPARRITTNGILLA